MLLATDTQPGTATGSESIHSDLIVAHRIFGQVEDTINTLEADGLIVKSADGTINTREGYTTIAVIIESLKTEAGRQPSYLPISAIFIEVPSEGSEFPFKLPEQQGILIDHLPDLLQAFILSSTEDLDIPENFRVSCGSVVADPAVRSDRYRVNDGHSAETVCLDQRTWAQHAQTKTRDSAEKLFQLSDEDQEKLSEPCGLVLTIPSQWDSAICEIIKSSNHASVERRLFGSDKG